MKTLPSPVNLSPHVAAEHNRLAKLHLAMGTAHAVLCGFELKRIQEELPKSPARWTFEQWLEENKEVLGFGRSTAFSYMQVAEHVQSTKLRKRDQHLVALLMSSPHKLCDADEEAIFKAVHKAVDGQSIRELLEEIKIARGEPTVPENTGGNTNNGGGHHAVRPEQLVMTDILEPLGKFAKGLNRMVRLGKDTKVHLWATMEPEQLRVTDKQLEVAGEEIAAIRRQISEALTK